MVATGLARNIPVATNHVITTTTYRSDGASEGGFGGGSLTPSKSTTTYANYFFGRKAETINRANQCTIVRGSTLTVEANRGYNIQQIEADSALLSSGGVGCFPGNKPALQSYWGGNSPLGLDMSDVKNGLTTLKSHVYRGFSRPIYDPAGAHELEADSPLHIATPTDCLANDFLLQQGFSCTTAHKSASIKDFVSYF